jgi:vancomycin permeability regulator SanA
LRTLILFCIAICGLTAVAIVFIGLSDNISKSDVGIIFGSKAYKSGQPSSRLAARLNKGIELYQKGFIDHIIVSGGTGKEGIDEALVMKNYLIAHRIPSHAIITDSHGNNTADTAINSRVIMQEHGFKSALVISQYFHILRAQLALKQCGISPIYHAHANYFKWRDLYSVPREIPAFYYYLLTKNGCQGLTPSA